MGGSTGIEPSLLHATVLGLAAVAAFTDTRRGEIPNWLTLPALALAPIAHGWTDGFGGVLYSLIGMLVCALVPLLLFYRGGMAGGDVKLFAAIGAVGGIYVGLEVQFLSLVIASIYALGQLTWNGKLVRSLQNSLFLGLNPVLPRRWRRTLSPELMHRIRLGAAILCGAAITIAGHHRGLWV
ncbi:MAG TPA: A24 family peptidase [Sandaracinaceae bacterium LLY-WYZ-13_1]|nr:A24 family peptidase [Sandaracinaceae bacterium LLY-WYZ-13_1]